ncbi:hypothetical protein GGER_26160 [Serratia rubidaea]
MATKIVLVGAGSAQFGFGTLGDIFQSKTLYGSEIVLHDINPASLAVTEKPRATSWRRRICRSASAPPPTVKPRCRAPSS